MSDPHTPTSEAAAELDPHADRRHEAVPAVFWPALVAGAVLIAFGVWTAHRTSPEARPWTIVRWSVTFGIVHDAIVVPVTLAVAWLLERVAGRGRAFIVRVLSASLACSAMAAVFAWPAIRRYGERPGNPSALPFDYTRHLLILLGVIWGIAVVRIVLAVVRRRRGLR